MTADSDSPKKGRGRPKGPEKPPKEKKPRGRPKGSGDGVRAPRPNHAPFTQLVQGAVKAVADKKGVSKVAIVKYIMDNEPECNDKDKVSKSVRTALKRLVDQKVLVAPKGTIGKFKPTDKAPSSKPAKKSPKKKAAKKETAQGERKKKSPVKKIKASPKKSPKKVKTPKKAVAAKKTPAKGTGVGRGRPKGSTKKAHHLSKK